MSKKQAEHNSFSAEDQLCFALAYEANAAAYALALTEAAGGQTWREQDFTMALFPFPHSISGVFLPRFKVEDCLSQIEMILEIAHQQRKKILFRLGPAPQPVDLAQRLLELGIRKSITQKYMAIPLTGDSPMLSEPARQEGLAGLRIYPVDDYGVLFEKLHPRLGAINSAKKRCLVQAYQKLAEQTPRRHWMFLGELEGKLIASVGLFLHQDSVAGYDLLVLPEYRRQGIGSATLRQIARFTHERGASLGVLASSVQGTHFYPRLGIAHIGGYPIYTYAP
jgi:N-acetylglutamate synthase-like GNAT family acetyltransferase